VSSVLPRFGRGNTDRYLHPLRAGSMRGLLSPASLRCVLSAAGARFALDRYGTVIVHLRASNHFHAFAVSGWPRANRLLFAPDLHAPAWPAAQCSNSADNTVPRLCVSFGSSIPLEHKPKFRRRRTPITSPTSLRRRLFFDFTMTETETGPVPVSFFRSWQHRHAGK
jgi:hypothetical protein